MDSNAGTLTRMYDCFNARDIDGVLSHLTDDVVWANAHRTCPHPCGTMSSERRGCTLQAHRYPPSMI